MLENSRSSFLQPNENDAGDARKLLFSIIYVFSQLYFYILGLISLLGY